MQSVQDYHGEIPLSPGAVRSEVTTENKVSDRVIHSDAAHSEHPAGAFVYDAAAEASDDAGKEPEQSHVS